MVLQFKDCFQKELSTAIENQPLSLAQSKSKELQHVEASLPGATIRHLHSYLLF